MTNFKLIQTCGACPEQYDVYYDDEKVGYMRLRHGYFRAEYLGKIVYEANPDGDGVFNWDERTRYLNQACLAIQQAMSAVPEEPLFTIEGEN